jgi:alpha-1,3-rhamnosyl/mannosyltransferase
VGELSTRKNLVRTLEAFEQSGLDDHVLVLAGRPGHGHDEIEQAASRLGERVRLVGHVGDSELPALYSAASTLCFATLYEGFGLPILESMRCGTPVMTATVGAAPEVADGHAVLVDPEDTADMAAGMQRAVSLGPEEREAGRLHAETFTWDACASATVRVYEEAVTT